MITKLLFTIVVIGVVFLLLGRSSRTPQRKALTTSVPVRQAAPLISPRFARIAAYVVIATMVAALLSVSEAT